MCADNRLQFTVPMDGMVLTAVGTMLLGLASALEGGRTQEDEYRRIAEKSAKKAAIERQRKDECGLEELRLGAASQCGCDADTVVYDSQAAQVDAAAVFGGTGFPMNPPPSVDPGFAEHTAHLNGGFVAPGHTAALPAVDLDTNGLPWDRRIHASTKTKCADGSWKKARGVDPAIVATVEAELKAAMSAPGPIVSPEVAAAQIVTPPPTEQIVTPPPVSAPPAPPQAVTPPPPAATGAMTFPEFLQRVTAMCTGGQTTHEAVAAACQKHGLAGIPLLASRPDLIPAVAAELGVV